LKSIPIFIGYDAREAVAYHTCVNSIIRYSTNPISINPLSLNLLKGYTETHTDGSNQFIYSRFLLPHLMDYNGWAIFIDGDMIIRDDITKLYNLQNNDYAVMVVKHDYKTKSNTKYLGSKNEDYPCKNWSSVVLWNCGHIKNKILTPELIQKSDGSYLHRFSWLTDNDIGSLPIEWNWLPDEYGENNNAKLLHYTLGTPCFNEFNNTTQASEWHKELELTTYCQQNTKI
jgi:lipopolysaccharide biosynthesis glycosyltransferase